MADYRLADNKLAVGGAVVDVDSILAITGSRVLYVSAGESTVPALRSVDATIPSTEPGLESKFLFGLPRHLDPAHARVTVINSVLAGRMQGKDLFEQLVRPLLEALNIDYKYVPTTDAHTIARFASSLSEISDARGDTVVILSGDTSVHELVNSLRPTAARRTVSLAPVPTGSGNSLMTSLSLATPASALFALLHGSPRPLNPFSVVFPPSCKEVIPPTTTDPDGKTVALQTPDSDADKSIIFVFVVVSWAIHAALVGDSDSPEYRKLGNDRFKIAARENLARNVGWHGPITYKTASAELAVPGPHSYVLWTTSSSLEPGFVIAPTAVPLSGKLEMVEIPFMSGDEIMRLLTLAYQGGKHVDQPEVLYTEVEEAEVVVQEAEERMRRWCVDGRIIVVPEGATVKVHSGQAVTRGWAIDVVV